MLYNKNISRTLVISGIYLFLFVLFHRSYLYVFPWIVIHQLSGFIVPFQTTAYSLYSFRDSSSSFFQAVKKAAI